MRHRPLSFRPAMLNPFNPRRRISSIARPVTWGTALLAVSAIACGCAQTAAWKMPWNDASRAERVKEKYGLTANQRVEEVEERAAAARSEGGQREEAFTAELVRSMLTEHDPRVRIKILDVAVTFETPSALSICRGALEDPDAKVRMAACNAWGKRSGDEAVKLLSHRYQTDTDIDVRLEAVRMLGAVEDQTAIPALARALEDPDPAVQYRAVASLKKVSGRDLGDDVNRWRAWVADPASEPDWSMAETFRKIF
jgi:hypothetical protein